MSIVKTVSLAISQKKQKQKDTDTQTDIWRERAKERQLQIMNFLHSLVHWNWERVCLLWFWMKNHARTDTVDSCQIPYTNSKHFEVNLSVNHRWKIVETPLNNVNIIPFFLIFRFPTELNYWLFDGNYSTKFSFRLHYTHTLQIFHSLSFFL